MSTAYNTGESAKVPVTLPQANQFMSEATAPQAVMKLMAVPTGPETAQVRAFYLGRMGRARGWKEREEQEGERWGLGSMRHIPAFPKGVHARAPGGAANAFDFEGGGVSLPAARYRLVLNTTTPCSCAALLPAHEK